MGFPSSFELHHSAIKASPRYGLFSRLLALFAAIALDYDASDLSS